MKCVMQVGSKLQEFNVHLETLKFNWGEAGLITGPPITIHGYFNFPNFTQAQIEQRENERKRDDTSWSNG